MSLYQLYNIIYNLFSKIHFIFQILFLLVFSVVCNDATLPRFGYIRHFDQQHLFMQHLQLANPTVNNAKPTYNNEFQNSYQTPAVYNEQPYPLATENGLQNEIVGFGHGKKKGG